MCRFLSHAFSVVRLYRTVCNYIFKRIRYVDFFHMRSLWFDYTELFVTTSSRQKRCIDINYMSSLLFYYTESSVATSRLQGKKMSSGIQEHLFPLCP